MTDQTTTLLVCGSRDIDDSDLIRQEIERAIETWEPDRAIHGGADGVDSIADSMLRYRLGSDQVDVHPIPEWVWETVGPKAGPMRNEYMVGRADCVLAIWDGQSEGTKNTIRLAESQGIPIWKISCTTVDGEWASYRRKLIEDDQRTLREFES